MNAPTLPPSNELLTEAEKFITGIAASGESGFARQQKALSWLRRHAEYERAQKSVSAPEPPVEQDVVMLRSIGAMTIAEGDEGWQRVPIDCPMLEAVAKLRRDFDAQREALTKILGWREIDRNTLGERLTAIEDIARSALTKAGE